MDNYPDKNQVSATTLNMTVLMMINMYLSGMPYMEIGIQKNKSTIGSQTMEAVNFDQTR